MDNHYRAYAEVDLDAAEHNYCELRRLIPKKTKLLVLVKADAYGHGAVPVARKLEALGVDFLGVADFFEAMQLRNAGIKTRILVLGWTHPELAYEMVKNDITQTVYDTEYAKELCACIPDGARLRAHIKLDTGLGRYGLTCTDREEQASCEAQEICSLEKLDIEGAYTHFAVADDPNNDYTERQLSLFNRMRELFEKKGIKIKIYHCANSAFMLNYQCAGMDMVRVGITFYGCHPSEKTEGKGSFIPVMSLYTVVTQLKTVPKGRKIGYGCNYETEKDTEIATVTIGYADGYLRALANKGRMLVRGRLASVIGNVCMDLCMLDVTGLGCKIGDRAEVFGKNIPARESVAAVNAIAYEPLTLLSKRIPKIYLEKGKVVDTLMCI